MEKIKTIVDRERLGSDYIESRQNFGQVLNEVNQLKPPVWKSAWFYGPVGVSVLAVVVSITAFDPPSSMAMSNTEQNPDYKALVAHVKSESKSPRNTIAFDKTTTLEHELEESSSTVHPKEIITTEHKAANSVVIEEVPVENDVNESVVESKYIYNGSFPNIDGVFNGDISVNQLLNGGGITSNPSLTITGFTINYFDGSEVVSSNVSGNKIPMEIGTMIKDYNIGGMIYITNIKANHEDGFDVSMSSLNYVITK